MIEIDLRKLTEVNLAEAMAHCDGRSCAYSSPCIIGTLIPEDRRREIDAIRHDKNRASSPPEAVGFLSKQGVFSIPEDQVDDAREIQELFDCGDWDGVEGIARFWMEQSND